MEKRANTHPPLHQLTTHPRARTVDRVGDGRGEVRQRRMIFQALTWELVDMPVHEGRLERGSVWERRWARSGCLLHVTGRDAARASSDPPRGA